jgi:hypothetical protein
VDGRNSIQIKNLLVSDWTDGAHKDSDLSELYAIGEACEQLLASPGWAAVDELLGRIYVHDKEALRIGLESSVSTGRIEDPRKRAEFGRQSGFLEGLRVAADAAHTIARFARERQAYTEDRLAQVEAAEGVTSGG